MYLEVKMKLSLILLCVACLSGCVANDNEAIKALDDQGFSNISIMDRGIFGADWAGCGQDDGAYYKAVATNPAGKRVNLLVCCGGAMSFKGCVVRSK
jgi:hypothetical protein